MEAYSFTVDAEVLKKVHKHFFDLQRSSETHYFLNAIMSDYKKLHSFSFLSLRYVDVVKKGIYCIKHGFLKLLV